MSQSWYGWGAKIRPWEENNLSCATIGLDVLHACSPVETADGARFVATVYIFRWTIPHNDTHKNSMGHSQTNRDGRRQGFCAVENTRTPWKLCGFEALYTWGKMKYWGRGWQWGWQRCRVDRIYILNTLSFHFFTWLFFSPGTALSGCHEGVDDELDPFFPHRKMDVVLSGKLRPLACMQKLGGGGWYK